MEKLIAPEQAEDINAVPIVHGIRADLGLATWLILVLSVFVPRAHPDSPLARYSLHEFPLALSLPAGNDPRSFISQSLWFHLFLSLFLTPRSSLRLATPANGRARLSGSGYGQYFPTLKHGNCGPRRPLECSRTHDTGTRR
jgi:hypothetical protein